MLNLQELASEIDLNYNSGIKYSVCTLMSRKEEYLEMVNSFLDAGFSLNFTEFLYIDNSEGNKADAYKGLNFFLQKAKGEYIILCHQDILLEYDKIDVLEDKIKELDILDPKWSLLSNAGAIGIKQKVMVFTESNGNKQSKGVFPQKVYSVDESFILVKKSANLSLSVDMAGFHFYGTDLCLINKYLGYSNYVIEFNLLHKSNGNLTKDFYDVKNNFINKYSKLLHIGYIQTTCTILYISSFRFKNIILNSKLVLFFVRNFSSAMLKLKAKISK